MADEAFALSPIAARAAQPSEADYDAIMEAFMETSRGRWFLGEYAKRNRNADTRLVLDAVARIEETLAAEKKPSRDPLLDEALAAFRGALAEIKGATEAALGDLALKEHLAPVHKSVRVIREITWRLREIGADGRICDLVDSQISAIEEATAKVATTDLPTALCEAFELVETRISAFDAGAAKISTVPPAEAAPPEALAQPQAFAQDEALNEALDDAALPAAEDTTVATLPAEERTEAAVETASTATDTEAASDAQAMAVDHVAEVAEVVESEPTDAFDTEDEAMLDRVALEMAAPDTDAAYEPVDEMADGATAATEMAEPQAPPAEASRVEAPPPAEPLAATENAHVPVDDIEITFVSGADEAPAEPVPETPLMEAPLLEEPVATAPIQAQVTQVAAEAQVAPEAEPEPSLGSSLIANGIVQRPRTSKPDPLAPIRRMSQSERIAFFS
jgi:hypothetical protein